VPKLNAEVLNAGVDLGICLTTIDFAHTYASIFNNGV